MLCFSVMEEIGGKVPNEESETSGSDGLGEYLKELKHQKLQQELNDALRAFKPRRKSTKK